MSLTVGQLVDIPSLRTRVLAGDSGSGRPVLWAHTCELPDPWNWLGTGELLLTDGYNFPVDGPSQIEYITHLAHANLSGVALAEGLHAAPLTPEAAKAADDLAFPVLETAYAVPFVTVARTVAESNSEVASGRLVRILRVYDVLRRSSQASTHQNDLLDALGRECGADLHVLDVRQGRSLLAASTPLEEEIRTSLVRALESHTGPLPAFVRVPHASGSLLGLPVDTYGRALLLAIPAAETDVDLVVLQHVATIAGLEVDRRAAAALRRRENGARFFQRLLDSAVDVNTAAERLSALGLGDRPWRILCLGTECEIEPDDLQLRLGARQIPHLIARSGDNLIVLVAASSIGADVFGLADTSEARVGLSQPVQSIGRVGDAAREARWALETARSTDQTVVLYGEESPLFMPRTVAEGEAVVHAVLGPLVDYDQETDSQLLRSLEVYFESGRSWQAGAARLGIHKQTLVYRMRRVEDLTGTRLADMDDQTRLYLALKTLRLLRTG
ncbi:PucR family transcriptional regulator [Nocardioides glacieisoli]|uniref:PucR family transcriptional regulator n=1 Tax=Nocardioides glacieisoli TaxID=1168730 RepID=UPI0013EB9396|nr:PucR family transcriptional regulator [Nocardioides glacieisoli]